MIKRAIITLIVLVVLVGGGLLVAKSLRANEDRGKNQYRIAKIEKGLVKKTVTATGVLKPWTVIDIRSRAGGRVITYGPDREKGNGAKVEEGTIVRKGDILLEIDPSDTLLTYNSARADIDSNRARVEQTTKELKLQEEQTTVAIQTAEANLQAAQAAVASAKARLDSAQAQASAQKDLTEATIANARATLEAETERLNQMKNATLQQNRTNASAQLRQTEANMKNAELQLNRQKALLEKGFVALSAVDQAQATYDVAVANYMTAKQRMDTIKPELEGDLRAQEARVKQVMAALRTAETQRVEIELRRQSAEAAEADYKRSLADLKQAEAQLRQARANRMNNAIRLTQIAQAKASGARAQASLVNAKVQLDETRVTAPRDGIILKKYIEEGTLIPSGISAFNSTGTNIAQLGDIARMYVDVTVDETDVANVDIDQKVDVVFDAYPTTPIEGKVIKIEPQAVIEQNVTTVHVRVEVDNTAPLYRLLKPGMNATCEFIIDRKPDVIACPNEAIRTEADGSRYVEIASGGKQAPPDKDSGEVDEALKVDVKIEKRKIQIGLEGNDTTEIIEGLKEGDVIITQTIEPSVAAPTGGGNPFGGGRGPGRR
jgi:HlyD family secretion protein